MRREGGRGGKGVGVGGEGERGLGRGGREGRRVPDRPYPSIYLCASRSLQPTPWCRVPHES